MGIAATDQRHALSELHCSGIALQSGTFFSPFFSGPGLLVDVGKSKRRCSFCALGGSHGRIWRNRVSLGLVFACCLVLTAAYVAAKRSTEAGEPRWASLHTKCRGTHDETKASIEPCFSGGLGCCSVGCRRHDSGEHVAESVLTWLVSLGWASWVLLGAGRSSVTASLYGGGLVHFSKTLPLGERQKAYGD